MCAGLFREQLAQEAVFVTVERMDVASRSRGSQLTCHRLVTVTYELLFILGSRDMKHWAKVSKITWEIFDEYECKEAALNEIRYWGMVEEGWFSD